MRKNKMLGDNLKPHNPVSNPAHYTSHGVSPLEFIGMQFGLEAMKGFCLGNAIKYISRAGKKDPAKEIEDLEKGVWYTQYYIEELKMKKEEAVCNAAEG